MGPTALPPVAAAGVSAGGPPDRETGGIHGTQLEKFFFGGGNNSNIWLLPLLLRSVLAVLGVPSETITRRSSFAL